MCEDDLLKFQKLYLLVRRMKMRHIGTGKTRLFAPSKYL